ncbi:MAG: ribonuclease D [Anaerolineae bacterium]|nr:ribonuclease D [Anaerolineae bacterium]MDW8072313.1 ribonuclease D [Anaerolineae bacterium]
MDTPLALERMLGRLQHAPAIAVDTESDSLYVYFEKICLVQLSIPGVDYLVDPLRVDITPLGVLFASRDHEKVFHAASYDILCLKRDYGFTFANIFDTMIAARILGWKHLGLAAILEERFGVCVDKRLQRYNWGLRPLPAAALEYARLDTHYLLPLRELQVRELKTRGKWAEAQRAFVREACIEPVVKRFDTEGFWRIPGAWQLDPTGQAILRELYILRDSLAREMDWPPFKVISNAAMVQLAADRPSNRSALEHVQGLSRRVRQRYADRLLEAITRGQRASMSSPPHTR